MSHFLRKKLEGIKNRLKEQWSKLMGKELTVKCTNIMLEKKLQKAYGYNNTLEKEIEELLHYYHYHKN